VLFNDLKNDWKDILSDDLKDELHQLEAETFEIEDIADIGIEAASGSSSCSTSSCCSCSTSSCCSCSTSCTG